MRLLSALALGAGVLAGAGCSHEINAHGNLPTEETLSRVQIGSHTRSDIQALLGTPSSTSMFGGETWYYISNQTTQIAFFSPEELRRQVIAVQFDDAGRVQALNRLSQADGRQIDIVTRETPTRGTETTAVQDFLGNLGRLSASQVGKKE